ncbi:epoxide hydrolase 1-like [Neofelis nebulosa]|uniref:epoxide hydrolase 1-like n=1 Tax=Neofelis nebulosa TaxID=61452 RepID=UPI00272BB6CF|nr:epoxide hydrolase 1-like [Neofelis nebulosa]
MNKGDLNVSGLPPPREEPRTYPPGAGCAERAGIMWLEILLASVLAFVVSWFVSRDKEETLPLEDGWWGPGARPTAPEDESIRPFKVETSDEEIKDLHRRIDGTRLTPPLEDSRFHYGFNSNYLKKILSYWRNEFDWRKQVEMLNRYPHFKTRIEGLDIHFVHVRPPQLPPGRTPKPLLMVHGWPGSFYEFYKIIPLLTDPVNHGLSEEHVFEVICPSIPGYAFSEAASKKGLNSVATARIFYKLMLQLGFREFYIQGGDWGALICTHMAQMVPSHVKGLHLNMVFILNGRILTLFLVRHCPRLFGFTQRDMELMLPFKEKIFYRPLRESGYMHIQSTKPDTVGCALNDSHNRQIWGGKQAGLEAALWCTRGSAAVWFCFRRKFSLDDLLTNVMLYWTTGAITSSQRFYKENRGQLFKQDRVKVSVPTGLAAFPCELMHVPERWVKGKYPRLVSYSYMPRGGHFAALEEPELLAQDIRKFVGLVELP